MQSARALRISFIAIGIILVGVIILFFATSSTEFGVSSKKVKAPGGNFTLQSLQGEVSLSDFRGKVVVFYFGFLNCPEVCPNSMQVLSNALHKLSDAQLLNVEAMLISLDPKRDTLKQLEVFSRYFHPNIIGATATQKTIDEITRQYGAYYYFTEIDRSGDYSVDHSSRYYVIDKTGKWVDAMRHSTTPNELAARIKSLLSP